MHTFLILILAIVFSSGTATAADSNTKKAAQPSAKEKISDDTVRFADNGDGTVLDRNTNLMWIKDANISEFPLSWQAARKFIQEMNGGERPNFGFSNWRLPSANDLETLIDKSQIYPPLPAQHPFENVQNHFYWSSSSGVDIIEYVWVLDMATGNKTMDYASFCNYRYLWPVRSTWTSKTASSGKILSSGLNEHGQLGIGSIDDKLTFSAAKNLNDVIKVAAGMEHAVAINADGTVWTWGRNSEGQLGNGSKQDSTVPILVKGLWNIVDVAAGMYHSVALKSDGTVWAWGRNSYGQLGNNSVDDSPLPVQVQGLSDVKKIGAGMYHTLALKPDGTAWAWGWNIYGQLGDGSIENKNTPVQVRNLTKVTDISAGLHHTVAAKSDGTVWAWGRNNYGLLGDGSTEDKHTPVKVQGLSDVVDVAAGLHHTLALKSNGTVWAWGLNEYGQLGISGKDKDKVPAALMVEELDNTRKITAGMYHSVSLMSDGTIWTWGKDLKNRVQKPLPIKIRDLSGVIDIAAGKYFTAVLSASEVKE